MKNHLKKGISLFLAVMLLCTVLPFEKRVYAQESMQLQTEIPPDDYFSGVIEQQFGAVPYRVLFSNATVNLLLGFVRVAAEPLQMLAEQFSREPQYVDADNLSGNFYFYLDGRLPNNANEEYRPVQLQQVFEMLGIRTTPAAIADALAEQDPSWKTEAVYHQLKAAGNSWYQRNANGTQELIDFDWGLNGDDADYDRFIKVFADVLGTNRPLFEMVLFDRQLGISGLQNFAYLYSQNATFKYNFLGEHTINNLTIGASIQSFSFSINGMNAYNNMILAASEMLFAAIGKQIDVNPTSSITAAAPFSSDLCSRYQSLSDESLANALLLPLKVFCDSVKAAPAERLLSLLPTLGLMYEMLSAYDAPTALQLSYSYTIGSAKVDPDVASGVSNIVYRLLSNMDFPLNISADNTIRMGEHLGFHILLEDFITKLLLGDESETVSEFDVAFGLLEQLYGAGDFTPADGLPNAVFSLQDPNIARCFGVSPLNAGKFYYVKADENLVAVFLHNWLQQARQKLGRLIPERIALLEVYFHPASAPYVNVEQTTATCTDDAVKTAACTLCDSFRMECVVERATGHAGSFVSIGNNRHSGICSKCGETVEEDCRLRIAGGEERFDRGMMWYQFKCEECGAESYVAEVLTAACSHTNCRYIVLRTGYHISICNNCGHCELETCALKSLEPVIDTSEQTVCARYCCNKCQTTYDVLTDMQTGNVISCDHRNCTYQSDPENPEKHIVSCSDCGKAWTEDCCMISFQTMAAQTPGAHCFFCDYSYDPIDECPHDYVAVKTVAPTCVDEGYTVFVCSLCENEKQDQFTEPTGIHSYAAVETKQPTCTEQGYTLYRCTVCEAEKKDDYTDPTGTHHFDAVKTVQPTCAEQGYTLYRCSDCEAEKKGDFTDPTGLHSYAAAETKAPSCTEKGYTVYRCETCTKEIFQDYVDPLGHAYERTVIVAPTENDPGEAIVACTRCGASYKETIPPSGRHDYLEVSRTPSCPLVAAEITYRCADCGRTFTEEGRPGPSHLVEENGICSICGIYVGSNTSYLEKTSVFSRLFRVISGRIRAMLKVYAEYGFASSTAAKIISSWPSILTLLGLR